jgi:hypothetical protein
VSAILDFVSANPWVSVAVAVRLAIWISAVMVIFKSPKFKRKWLWFFVSVISFSNGFHVSPSVTLWIGVPVGAFYVLWYWRFGKPQITPLNTDNPR